MGNYPSPMAVSVHGSQKPIRKTCIFSFSSYSTVRLLFLFVGNDYPYYTYQHAFWHTSLLPKPHGLRRLSAPHIAATFWMRYPDCPNCLSFPCVMSCKPLVHMHLRTLSHLVISSELLVTLSVDTKVFVPDTVCCYYPKRRLLSWMN